MLRKSLAMTAEPGALGSASTTVLADSSDAGQRLDRALALHLPALSRTRLKQLIESGHVTCEGTAVREPALRVRSGQNFVVILPEDKEPAPSAQPIALSQKTPASTPATILVSRTSLP